jgi:hypothetical protein
VLCQTPIGKDCFAALAMTLRLHLTALPYQGEGSPSRARAGEGNVYGKPNRNSFSIGPLLHTVRRHLKNALRCQGSQGLFCEAEQLPVNLDIVLTQQRCRFDFSR